MLKDMVSSETKDIITFTLKKGLDPKGLTGQTKNFVLILRAIRDIDKSGTKEEM